MITETCIPVHKARTNEGLGSCHAQKEQFGSISKPLLTETKHFPAFPSGYYEADISLPISAPSSSSRTARSIRMLIRPPESKHHILNIIRTPRFPFVFSKMSSFCLHQPPAPGNFGERMVRQGISRIFLLAGKHQQGADK